MAETVKHGGLTVAKQLYEFVNTEALPGTGVEPDVFWAAADDIIHKFSPKIASALRKRKSLQNKINRWHKQNAGQAIDPAAYRGFLEEIGYIVPDRGDCKIATRNTDDERMFFLLAVRPCGRVIKPGCKVERHTVDPRTCEPTMLRRPRSAERDVARHRSDPHRRVDGSFTRSGRRKVAEASRPGLEIGVDRHARDESDDEVTRHRRAVEVHTREATDRNISARGLDRN